MSCGCPVCPLCAHSLGTHRSPGRAAPHLQTFPAASQAPGAKCQRSSVSLLPIPSLALETRLQSHHSGYWPCSPIPPYELTQ